jgi:hypothetical protein
LTLPPLRRILTVTAKREAKKRRIAAKRKRQARNRNGQATLIRRVERSPLFADADLRIGPPGQLKMSEVIVEFAEPLLDAARDDREYRNALGLAIVAWNVSLLPERMWTATLPKHLRELASEEDVADDLGHLLTGLIHRKERFYPHVRRLVLDYEITRSSGDRRLDVVSTLA